MTVNVIEPLLDLDQIQGNILGGFNRDHQTWIFFRLPTNLAQAQGWLAELAPDVATAKEVSLFNQLFKLVNSRRDSRHRGEREQPGSTLPSPAPAFSGCRRRTWINVS